MKKAILFLLLAGSFSAKAQSLKDLLYSGKLKSDSNSVVRATDDLKSKIDTTTRKAPEVEKPKPVMQNTSSQAVRNTNSVAQDTALSASSKANTEDVSGNANTGSDTTAVVATEPAPKIAAPRTNNKIWKDYTDSLNKVLSAEVLNTKKIKKGTYYIMLDYELAPDGSVTVTNVTSTPENALLQAAVKDRVEGTAPRMNPIPDATATSKKLKRRYSFNVTKD